MIPGIKSFCKKKSIRRKERRIHNYVGGQLSCSWMGSTESDVGNGSDGDLRLAVALSKVVKLRQGTCRVTRPTREAGARSETCPLGVFTKVRKKKGNSRKYLPVYMYK